MHKPRPTESQCLAASAAFPMQRVTNARRDKSWEIYSANIGGTSVSSSDRVRLGAMYIAADNDRKEVNAAWTRAASLIGKPARGLARSAVASDLALTMLRREWRRKLDDFEQWLIEKDARERPDFIVDADPWPGTDAE